MFNIGGSEVLVIALIALIVVGPEQLPSVLRKAGKELARFRSMTSSIRDEFMAGVEEMDPTTWDNAPRTAAKPISTPEEFRAHLDDEERQAEERAMGEVGRQEQQNKFSASAAKHEIVAPDALDTPGAPDSPDLGDDSDISETANVEETPVLDADAVAPDAVPEAATSTEAAAAGGAAVLEVAAAGDEVSADHADANNDLVATNNAAEGALEERKRSTVNNPGKDASK